ncbi:uncharacterized protein UTRI_10485 [Ustilago trichophora]|uniref:Uncharacterized protein n=1 Tax=Ustilago trichophora TaxID=86804 RepID=A0A5C3EAA9_9BASI|nr:uncharacterized protein UTRI_10485 [Ustilago trichophora]
MLFLDSTCKAVPAGPIPSNLAEDLARNTQQSHSVSAIKTFFLKIRAKLLRSKTTERWIRTFATATPSTTSVAAKALRVPDEDALVRYRDVSGRASTDAATAGSAKDGNGGKTQAIQLSGTGRRTKTLDDHRQDVTTERRVASNSTSANHTFT